MIFRSIFYVLIISSVVYCAEISVPENGTSSKPTDETAATGILTTDSVKTEHSTNSAEDEPAEDELALTILEDKLKSVFGLNENISLYITGACADRLLEKCDILKNVTVCSPEAVVKLKECLKKDNWDLESKEDDLVCKEGTGEPPRPNSDLFNITNNIHCKLPTFLDVTSVIGTNEKNHAKDILIPQILLIFFSAYFVF